MPASLNDSFPPVTAWLQAARLPLATSLAVTEGLQRSLALGFDLTTQGVAAGLAMARQMNDALGPYRFAETAQWIRMVEGFSESGSAWLRAQAVGLLTAFQQRRRGELDFIDLFIDPSPPQTLACNPTPDRLLLDLPSLRLWDISLPPPHAIGNFCVVFAPRAGHHSNIAERAALFMRERGLTRMALVEQKCADEIPLFVDGQRHREGFDSQVQQYRQVLTTLRARTGRPVHMVAVCQPGPLLMATLILYPDLGRTFGSAGAPMHTEAQSGFLTDFARTMGPDWMDLLLQVFGRRVAQDRIGQGRPIYDGRLQVLGFYLLGATQHLKNLGRLLTDLRHGNIDEAERQRIFYRWYNYTHHFPAGFIRDTYRKIFFGNELIRGKLLIGGRTIGIKDYPAGVPIWALGGKRDDIAPELQAVGHLPLIDALPEADKFSLTCDGGHMALFRSERILNRYYTPIVDFLLARSD